MAAIRRPTAPIDMDMIWMVIAAVVAAEPGVQPVDPGVADVGPLGISFRRMQRDFRKPTGFDRVYQTEDGRFARGSGALTAVFPRSQYARMEDGRTMILVPADTRFVIGSVAADNAGGRTGFPAREPRSRSMNAGTNATETAVPRGADRGVERQMVPPAGVEAQARRPEAPAERHVLTDDRYRVARVATLLSEAAAAE